MKPPRPTPIDAVTLLVLAAASIGELSSHDLPHPFWMYAVGAVVLFAPLVVRSRAPVAAFGGYTLTAMGLAAALEPVAATAAMVAGVILACYSAGVGLPLHRVRYAAAWIVVPVVVVSVLLNQDAIGSILFPLVFFAWVPMLVGAAVRHRRELTAELAAKSEQLEHDREERARRAVHEERTRIARELHDLVAHSVSVMVVQSGAARRLVDEDPARAERAALMIEATGREALTELRRLLGVLRRGDEELALAPQPSLRRVDALVERSRAGGLEVELRVEGDPAHLSTVVDLAGYRIVQEALTNTMKHSGGGTALVLVRYGDEEVEVEVSDTGSGPHPGDGDGRDGHGLIGMRERVALVGGELEAGRRRGGGYAVRARLPRDPVAA